MILLRNKDQQQNNPLASFAICLSRQRSGHERIAISLLHNTRTVNWFLCSVSVILANKLSLQQIK